MATTSPDNIYYPVSTDQVAPLASHFENLAESTQEALDNKVNDDDARLSDERVPVDGSVTEDKLADNSVTSAKIVDGTIVNADIANTTIESGKLAELDYVKFDVTYAGGSTQPGELAWDADNETLQFQLDPHVTLQVGQEHLIRVKNNSGSVAIPNGTVVMFAGAAGDTVTVAPAVSDGTISINYLVGITTEQIPADGFGFVTQLGYVNGVNTNAYNVGDILYPNPAVPGGLTNVEPEAPNWKIPIAAVTKKNASSGRLLVRAIGGGGGGGASVVVADAAPESGANGDLWYDSVGGTIYVYYEDDDGSQWVEVKANSGLAASFDTRLSTVEDEVATGGSGVIKLNPNVLSTSYTIPSGWNGMSAGPITIASGVTVTIPAGSAWSIV